MKGRIIRLLAITLTAVLAFGLVVLLLFYNKPVTTMSFVQRGLVRLSGFHSKFVTVEGNKIHYIEGGKGPTMIMLHGHPSKAEEWAPVLREFSEHNHVIALDLLGYGESDEPDIQYTIGDQVRVVRGLMRELGIPKARILGYSMGGWIALKLAVESPDVVEKLVLVNSGGFRFTPPFTSDIFVPKTLEEFKKLQEFQASGAELPDFIAVDLLNEFKRKEKVYRRAGESLLSMNEAMDGKVGGVTMPVLILWGLEDRMIPLDNALRMKEEIPSATLSILDGCGHALFWQCGDRAVAEIQKFLH